MLNVVLSFAQYEREISAERVRDKIAASKKLGYWMGGYPPLGYDVKDRGLVINPEEAINVRLIYDKFLETKSITKTLEFTKDQKILTKTGRLFCKKTIRDILTNPIYKGFVSHKGTEYKGRHEAIISEEKFAKVQSIWAEIPEKCKQKVPSDALLKDLIRCGSCNCPMTPTYCCKNKRKYRYYTCSNHLRTKNCMAEHKTLPAGEIEKYVSNFVCKSLKSPEICATTINNLGGEIEPNEALEKLKNIEKVWETLAFDAKRQIVQKIVRKVEVIGGQINLFLNQDELQGNLQEIAE